MTNVIDLSKCRQARETNARRKALLAKHRELADVRVADRAFQEMTVRAHEKRNRSDQGRRRVSLLLRICEADPVIQSRLITHET